MAYAATGHLRQHVVRPQIGHGNFGSFNPPLDSEDLAITLKERFLKTGRPRNLTLTYAAGQGDGKTKGLNHLAQEGLVGKLICGHTGVCPALGKLVYDNKILAYNVPMGAASQLYRDIAAGKPGNLTHVGLGTFIDPRVDGGKINELTKTQGEDIITLMNVRVRDYLFYHAFPIHVAFLRGTSADPDGNITMEKEAMVLDALAMPQAVRNSGGVVIVQVERIADSGKYAVSTRQQVLYITEHCVFTLCEEGLELIEIAPGIDLETQVLALMDFKPVMRRPPKLMDNRIFRLRRMGIKDDLLNIPVQDRFTYHPAENTIYINLENYYMKNSEEIQEMKKVVGAILEPLGRKVHTIVNYDNFNVSPHMVDEIPLGFLRVSFIRFIKIHYNLDLAPPIPEFSLGYRF